jgi:hypothetical protein
MKTLEEALQYKFLCWDGRDRKRLSQFVKEEDFPKLELEIAPEFKGKHQPIPFTRDNVLKQLKEDVEFGWKKACDERGISSSFMFECVKFWNWVLDEGLEYWSDDDFFPYGKPLFEATAEKYGWELDGATIVEDNSSKEVCTTVKKEPIDFKITGI